MSLRDKIALTLANMPGTESSDVAECADAILKTIEESVPPLEWEAEEGNESCLDAEGCDKLYRIIVRSDGRAVLRHNASSFQEEGHSNVKAAKAAAQADYTSRILKAAGIEV